MSVSVFCKFAAYFTHHGLKYRTIKSHLSGIHYLQVRSRLQEPFHSMPMLQLEYTFRGIKWVEDDASHYLTNHEADEGVVAAYGGMSGGEADVCGMLPYIFWFLTDNGDDNTRDQSYIPSIHLSFGDVAVDNKTSISSK